MAMKTILNVPRVWGVFLLHLARIDTGDHVSSRGTARGGIDVLVESAQTDTACKFEFV